MPSVGHRSAHWLNSTNISKHRLSDWRNPVCLLPEKHQSAGQPPHRPEKRLRRDYWRRHSAKSRRRTLPLAVRGRLSTKMISRGHL